ncbi:MAG TPA: outer membrane beta-barrel protein [Candidatus Angelobacter sp.]
MRKLSWIFVLFLVLSISAAAQDYPKAEVFGGYSYVHTSVLGTGFNFNGASGSIAFNPKDWFGIVADFGGYHNGDFGVSTNVITYLFGPKFAYRKNARVTPYFQTLFGGAHVGASFSGLSGSDSAFAMAIGGGIDAKIHPHVAIRVIQAEYLLTKFNDGSNNRQNNARISAGIVFRWGGK